MTDNSQVTSFDELGLPSSILDAIRKVGYETPSPIQAATIPHLLEGRDVLGLAQTGTGKTAAFALPILANIDLRQKSPQVLVLAPTRELAIQVAEAFQTYAQGIRDFHVAAIYGGADYRGQLRQLKRGAHVIVGTPGRVMDHMRRGSLDISELRTMVLDEADEMLRMGFIDDVRWILDHAPEERQVALFSATMPKEIHAIVGDYLNDPAEVKFQVKTRTAETIRQRFMIVSNARKMEVLTRILEAEPVDGMIIFVRTKNATVEVSDKLSARGFASSALNGDMAQNLRENVIDKLKKGRLDIVVATDVAARGIDVERISHVINFDIPYDAEAYVHRIGRTGRAGREGDAILFVAPREKRMLSIIERATRKQLEQLELPSVDKINDVRIAKFRQRISDTITSSSEVSFFRDMLMEYIREHDLAPEDVAAALAVMAQGDQPLILKEEMPAPRERREREPRERRERGERGDRGERPRRRDKSLASAPAADEGSERFRIFVGHEHGAKPGNIVGAIANEAGIDASYIGRIEIYDRFSTVDLPEGMPKEVFQHLKKVRVAGEALKIIHEKDAPDTPDDSFRSKPRRKPDLKRKPDFKKKQGFNKKRD
ncbi:DEAD/DEAH box helicase [Biformimicrobium ophioploci]|uniref:ATP-dependent RNA helicase DeaD n=1 Tax=Biformimicrobium ophioploci TaxID=3036711 RepID=A0ABQ6LZ23_9GAMM|nr:DEAD/DEAH box helicase [Microbulbifer sp. NKW57]GMG87344.1 DEAD/DEAH box helicase [Microbulbifer sp. NKW57]